MLNPSKVLYIPDFDFGEDHLLRNKYVIILHNTDNKLILLSLTTSKCHIPDEILQEGCIRYEDRMIHSFFFPKDKILSSCGFFFPSDTFIDINRFQVFEKEIDYINAKYIDKGNIVEKCKLLDEHFFELLYCIYRSKFLPKKTKASLEVVLEKLSKNKS
jgi:hypothetical protein